jgi:organic radical activating enzyme
MDVVTTIQGEGINIGKPVILVRLNGCNLCCPFCDTKDHIKHYKFKLQNIIDPIIAESKKYPYINKLLITGGEPLCEDNIDSLKDVLYFFNGSKIINKFEIETNGTCLYNIEKVLNSVRQNYNKLQFNISPKMYSESYPKNIKNFDINEKEIIYNYYNQFKNYIHNTHINYYVKFIYEPKRNHINNLIYEYIYQLNIPKERVLIMPFTPDKKDKDFMEKFELNCKEAIQFCQNNGFRYSPREQVYLNIK